MQDTIYVNANEALRFSVHVTLKGVTRMNCRIYLAKVLIGWIGRLLGGRGDIELKSSES